jgi:hypothetical protein
MKQGEENTMTAKNKSTPQKPKCVCVADPFADLPPEARPRLKKPPMGNLRQVICPECGLKYWTNRSTDLCVNCEKQQQKLSSSNSRRNK